MKVWLSGVGGGHGGIVRQAMLSGFEMGPRGEGGDPYPGCERPTALVTVFQSILLYRVLNERSHQFVGRL
jgi:hypothetical protein